MAERQLLEWQGKVLPAGWEQTMPHGRQWYRYQLGQNAGDLIRVLVGVDRDGWHWRADVRGPYDQDWLPMGWSAAVFPRAPLACRAADEALAPLDDPRF